MYAVTIGTTSYRAISSELDLLPGEVMFSGTPIEEMVWDDVLGNIRAPNPTELLEKSKQLKIMGLKDDCTNYIQAGFTSNALGTAHVYDSALPQDQINLVGAKMAGIDMAFTCADGAGYKSQKLHTAAQITQVYIAAMMHLQTAKARFYARKLAVEALTVEAGTTQAEIDAVVW